MIDRLVWLEGMTMRLVKCEKLKMTQTNPCKLMLMMTIHENLLKSCTVQRELVGISADISGENC